MLISQHWNLNKTQAELDFVDIPIDDDLRVFLDPFAISQQRSPFAQECRDIIREYFQFIIELIGDGNEREIVRQTINLKEPSQVHLGYGRHNIQGAGIGANKGAMLINALRSSEAARDGMLSSLEECNLFIPSVSFDGVSDLTVNLLRGMLIDYTQEQCKNWGQEITEVAVDPIYDSSSHLWVGDYRSLPLVRNKPVILVPKIFVRRQPVFKTDPYYNKYILEFIQAEHLEAGSGLCTMLKNGERRKPTKKILKEQPEYSKSKDFLREFTRRNPEVLNEFRRDAVGFEVAGTKVYRNPLEDEASIANQLIVALDNIPSGNATAQTYHDFMTGALELIMYPYLTNPRVEVNINERRKRIDICYENVRYEGPFDWVHSRLIHCPYIWVECKNYTDDIANNELDQLSGRFSPQRGRFGILCSRNFNNFELFKARCRDTYRDDRGLIVPIEDNIVKACLEEVARGNRMAIDEMFRNIINEIAQG